MKDSIVIYKSWKPLIDSLPDALKIDFYELLWGYDGLEYNPIIDNPHLNGIFQFVLVKIKDNESKYADKCGKASASIRKRWNKDEPSEDTKNTNVYERINGNTNHTDKDKDKDKDKGKDQEKKERTNEGRSPARSSSSSTKSELEVYPDEAPVFQREQFNAFAQKIGYGHAELPIYLGQIQRAAEKLGKTRTAEGWEDFVTHFFNNELKHNRLILPAPEGGYTGAKPVPGFAPPTPTRSSMNMAAQLEKQRTASYL